MITGRPPSVSVAVVIIFLISDFLYFIEEIEKEHYGGYKLFLNTDLKVNLFMKVIK